MDSYLKQSNLYTILHCDNLNHLPNRLSPLSMIQVLSEFVLFV